MLQPSIIHLILSLHSLEDRCRLILSVKPVQRVCLLKCMLIACIALARNHCQGSHILVGLQQEEELRLESIRVARLKTKYYWPERGL